jgi:glycine/D-amino acid oxidase-like deaminating enzyme
MPEQIETVIIGGGHAGLALSYLLKQRGHEHLIVERGRLAERWRSERWDSLTLLTPNWASALRGLVTQVRIPTLSPASRSWFATSIHTPRHSRRPRDAVSNLDSARVRLASSASAKAATSGLFDRVC